MENKALLVVSFGTTHEDTRIKNIDLLEKELQEAAGGIKLYRAWTSKIIMAVLKKRDNILIDDVKTAMQRMLDDGIKEVYVQPTHIVNGIEYDMMKADIEAYNDKFERIVCASPLLTLDDDYNEVVKAYANIIDNGEWNLEFEEGFVYSKDDTAVVFMGHGSDHHVNSVYAALDYRFKERGLDNVFVGTVEAYPDFDTVLKELKKHNYKKVVLTPLMLVAGDHAKNDMAGDDEEAWNTLLKNEGYQVAVVLKGMGEYEGIRNIYIRHILEVIGDMKRDVA